MIKIELCLKDSEGNESILTEMKLPSNPFKVGDKVNLNLNSLRHEIYSFKDSIKESIMTNHKLFQETVHLKTAVLIDEQFFLDIDLVHESQLSVSYTCEIID
jgi:hypothetical protein